MIRSDSHELSRRPTRRVLFLGPPGAGKGTQAALVSAHLGIPHISTGEMLRANVAAGTELGAKAEAVMQAGDLVPDDLVVSMLEERLADADARHGYILDGFPRNAAQAETLDGVLADEPLDGVIVLDVEEDELVARMLSRGRADDTDQAVRHRLVIYREETEPLIAFYADRGLVRPVKGHGDVEDITVRIIEQMSR